MLFLFLHCFVWSSFSWLMGDRPILHQPQRHQVSLCAKGGDDNLTDALVYHLSGFIINLHATLQISCHVSQSTSHLRDFYGGTGSYSDTPYSDSSYSDNSYSAAKVFMHDASDVRNCHCTFGGNFIRFVRRPFQHVYFSTIASVCYSLLFPHIPTMCTYFPHISAYFRSLLAHIWTYSEYFSHIFSACTQRIFGK